MIVVSFVLATKNSFTLCFIFLEFVFVIVLICKLSSSNVKTLTALYHLNQYLMHPM